MHGLRISLLLPYSLQQQTSVFSSPAADVISLLQLHACCKLCLGRTQMFSDTPSAPSQCWICRLHSGSSAENDQSSADDLQQMAHELAASKQGKSAVVVWNRALLHQLAGQAHYQDGMPQLSNAKLH